MKRTALYYRVSGKNQEDNTSLAGQLALLTEEAHKRGYEIVDAVSDVGSGGDFNRDGWKRILHLAENQAIDVVMFRWLDRSTRGGPEAFFVMEYELKRLGVTPEYLDIPDGDGAMVDIYKTVKSIGAQQYA